MINRVPSTAHQPESALTEQQDLVNKLLTAADRATAALHQTGRAAGLSVDVEPQIAADLDDAAAALIRVRHMVLTAADKIANHTSP